MINEQIAGLLRNNAGNPQMVSRIASENRVSQDEIAGALRIPRENAARYMGRGMGRGRGIQPAPFRPAQPIGEIQGGFRQPELQPIQPAVQPELRPIQLDSPTVMPAPNPIGGLQPAVPAIMPAPNPIGGLKPESTMPVQPIANSGASFSPPDQAMPINVAAPTVMPAPKPVGVGGSPPPTPPIPHLSAPGGDFGGGQPIKPTPTPQPVVSGYRGPANIGKPASMGKPLGNNQAFTAGFNSVRRGR